MFKSGMKVSKNRAIKWFEHIKQTNNNDGNTYFIFLSAMILVEKQYIALKKSYLRCSQNIPMYPGEQPFKQ